MTGRAGNPRPGGVWRTAECARLTVGIFERASNDAAYPTATGQRFFVR